MSDNQTRIVAAQCYILKAVKLLQGARSALDYGPEDLYCIYLDVISDLEAADIKLSKAGATCLR